MKKIVFFLTSVIFVTSLIAQTNDPSAARNQEDMNKKIQQLEKSVQDNSWLVEQLRRTQASFEEKMEVKFSEYEVYLESNMAEMDEQMQQFEMASQSEISRLQKELEQQKKLGERTMKRQKIHFIVIYVLLFLSLMGLVFVYLYYSKLFKDFDLFQQKRLNDLKVETQNSIDANHKHLVSKVDTACDEIRKEQEKSKQLIIDFRETFSSELGNIAESTEKSIAVVGKSADNVANKLSATEKDVTVLGKQLAGVSAGLEKLVKETEKQVELLKKQQVELEKKVTKASVQKPVAKTNPRKPKEE